MIKKKIGIFVISIVLLSIIAFSLTGKQGFISLYQNRTRYHEQQAQLIRSNQIIDSLKSEIKRLKHDTGYIEKIAREKLGMAKKNEKVFKFIEDEPNNQK